MKSLFIILFTMVVGLFSFAQQRQFINGNKKWVSAFYQNIWQSGNPIPQKKLEKTWNHCMGISDTTINDTVFRKISICGGEYVGGIYENGKKVRFIPKGYSNSHLLYDFGANAGDTLKNVIYQRPFNTEYEFADYRVSNVSSVILNGIEHKVLQVENAEWIEGIGNDMGLFMESWQNVSDYQVKLVCNTVDRTKFFPEFESDVDPCENLNAGLPELKNESRLTVFPNPSSDEIQILGLQNENTSVSIYAHTGKLIRNITVNPSETIHLKELESGIYLLSIKETDSTPFTFKLVKH